MRSIIVVLLFLPLTAFGQTGIAVYTGATFPSIDLSSEPSTFSPVLRDHWYPGINVGVGAQFHLLDWIDVCPQIEYGYYFFKEFRGTATAGSSFILSATGHPSRVYRFMAESRLIHHTPNGSAVYFSTGLAYVIENHGSIDMIWSGPDDVTSFQFRDRYFWAHSFGAGAQIRLSNVLLLDLNLRTYTNYRDPWDLSINSGVTFRLPE